MNETRTPFNELFRARTGSTVLQWNFPSADLNESARELFRHVDRLFEVLNRSGFVFLSTIELDADAGRFPDVLAQYFRDEVWADTQSYFVAPIRRVGPGTLYDMGRLTFEASPGQTQRVLAQDRGFRWGSGLRVWWLQVAENRIADTIDMAAEDATQANLVQKGVRAAWLASSDLDALSVWLSPSVDVDSSARVTHLRTG
jgi:hypothetical protein